MKLAEKAASLASNENVLDSLKDRLTGLIESAARFGHTHYEFNQLPSDKKLQKALNDWLIEEGFTTRLSPFTPSLRISWSREVDEWVRFLLDLVTLTKQGDESSFTQSFPDTLSDEDVKEILSRLMVDGYQVEVDPGNIDYVKISWGPQ